MDRRRFLSGVGGAAGAAALIPGAGPGAAWPDLGGSPIAQPGATQTASQTGAPGPGWFDVRAYGAVGDGKHDDTAAIQAAIDAGCTARSSVICFPPGLYAVSAALTLPDEVSHPYTSITFRGPSGVQQVWAHTGASIVTTGTALFVSKTTPTTGGLLHSVQLHMESIQCKAYYETNPACVCFKHLLLCSSHVRHCSFYGFGTFLLGSFCGVSVFESNGVSVVRFVVKASDYSSSGSTDSFIAHNYLNGLGNGGATLTTLPYLDLVDSGTMTVHHNYFDFTYYAFRIGGGGGWNLVQGNIFDYCPIAIGVEYGWGNDIVAENRFIHINKSWHASFRHPLSGMFSNDWTCIKMGTGCGNKTIVNNHYATADRFLTVSGPGHWNIVESGNMGAYPPSGSPPPPAVLEMSAKTIDTHAYPLDGTRLKLDSLHYPSAGVWADRPTLYPMVGQMYFATDHESNGSPRWWNGTNWVDYRGAVVP